MPVNLLQNSVVQATIKITETKGPNVFYNRLRYRLTEGLNSIETDDVLEALHTSLAFDNLIGSWVNRIASQCHIESARWQIIGPTPYAFLEKSIGLDCQFATSDYTPRRAAVLTRYSYMPGHEGVGRIMFGPLGEEYSDGDVLDPDPLLNGGLEDILTHCAAPLVTTGFGTWNPCIVGNVKTDPEFQPNPGPKPATPNHDVRTQKWAKVVTYLSSRSLKNI